MFIAILQNNASPPICQSVKYCVRNLCRASARLQISSLSFALCQIVLPALFYWTQISIPPLQVRGALSGGWGGCLCQWELKAPTDRSRSDCVHEQVAKRIANVRFTSWEVRTNQGGLPSSEGQPSRRKKGGRYDGYIFWSIHICDNDMCYCYTSW